MHSRLIMQRAREMFLTGYDEVVMNCGILPPSKNKNPINPPLTILEYEAMERDTSKYFLYYAALSVCFKELHQKSNKDPSKIFCMVVGAGRGRLVDYCEDCASDLGLDVTVYVIEVNREINQLLKEKYKFKPNIIVLPPTVIRSEYELYKAAELDLTHKVLKSLLQIKKVDLFVSELFGSFADNEFISEILTTCKNMFGKADSISIPVSYTTYVCAVSSPSLNSHFKENPKTGMYILGLPKDVCLSELLPLYSNSCTTTNPHISANIELPLSSKLQTLTGIAGYFRAKLYNNIFIDTTPSSTRNAFFWETAFFPMNFPTGQLIDESSKFSVQFSRSCDITEPRDNDIFDLGVPVFKICYKWLISHFSACNFDSRNISNTHVLYL